HSGPLPASEDPASHEQPDDRPEGPELCAEDDPGADARETPRPDTRHELHRCGSSPMRSPETPTSGYQSNQPSPPRTGAATMSGRDAANALDSGQTAATELAERDREILNFERQWWKYAGAKEQAVREKFDMSSTRYYQVLNALIDRPDALAFDPLLVRRLRRLRAARQRARSARRLGFEVSE